MTTLLILLSYFYADREVSTFVYENHIPQFTLLLYFTYIAKLFYILAPVLIVGIAIRGVLIKHLGDIQRGLLAMAVTLLVASQVKQALKVVFSRYWPQTWVNDNPSWIENGAYGFHWFCSGKWYESFPSGHTTAAFVVAVMAWHLFPKYRWSVLFLCTLVPVGLMGMNYHFLSDCIAGVYLGYFSGLVGVACYRQLRCDRIHDNVNIESKD